QYSTEGKTPVFEMRDVGLEDYHVTSVRFIGQDEENIKIVKRFEAQGPNRTIAAENAQMVTYQISRNDSVYTFDSNLTFKENATFRAQRVKVDVYVPYDQPFVVDEYLWEIIDNYGRHFYRDNHTRNTWKMTPLGIECVTCLEPLSSSARVKDQFGLRDFESIELTGIFDVRIDQGEEYSVEVQGSTRQKEHYDIFMENRTLVIDYDNDHERFFWNNDLFEDDKVIINITMPNLRELDVKGAGKLKFRNFRESDVEIKLMGAIVAEGQINANSLDIDITGASFLDLDGRGSFLEADVTGASGLRAYEYEVERAVIEAHGASSARVTVNETLEINKSFASKVSHRGNARVTRNN
ncbi:MAG: head GIN domain-containing protein, partial [Cyclobacteriaceae bacterium]